MKSDILFTDSPAAHLDHLLVKTQPDKLYLLTDKTTTSLALPLLKQSRLLKNAVHIEVADGEAGKSIDSAITIWETLSTTGATRQSLLVCLGGGAVSDLGGFAAATFKRGMDTIYIPTTLLAAVDASVGGKTAVNFLNFKNEIGVFALPKAVIISPVFFDTLSDMQLKEGFAEILKMAYLFRPALLKEMLQCEPEKLSREKLMEYIKFAVEEKERVVAQDFRDKGMRKLLNFGHTAGHAIETLSHIKGVAMQHGICVAHGILFALVLSNIFLELPESFIDEYEAFLKRVYPPLPAQVADKKGILQLMKHDKKNQNANQPAFALIAFPGDGKTNCPPAPEMIDKALDVWLEKEKG